MEEREAEESTHARDEAAAAAEVDDRDGEECGGISAWEVFEDVCDVADAAGTAAKFRDLVPQVKRLARLAEESHGVSYEQVCMLLVLAVARKVLDSGCFFGWAEEVLACQYNDKSAVDTLVACIEEQESEDAVGPAAAGDDRVDGNDVVGDRGAICDPAAVGDGRGPNRGDKPAPEDLLEPEVDITIAGPKFAHLAITLKRVDPAKNEKKSNGDNNSPKDQGFSIEALDPLDDLDLGLPLDSDDEMEDEEEEEDGNLDSDQDKSHQEDPDFAPQGEKPRKLDKRRRKGIVTCRDCGQVMSNMANLTVHSRQKHSKVVCTSCGESFATVREMAEHRETTHKEWGVPSKISERKCPVCGRVMLARLLARHARTKHGQHVCGRCVVTFDTAESVRNHKCEAKPAWLKERTCCGATMTYYKYKRHVRRVHQGRPERARRVEVPCELCGKVFLKKYLLEHRRMVHPDPDDPVVGECDECGKAFTSRIRYHHHMDSHKNSRYPCEVCGLTYARRRNRDQHFKKEHQGSVEKKPCPCQICGKHFSRMSVLRTHIRTVHEKDRPFVCEACGKSCGQKGSLKLHMRMVHKMDV